MSDADVATALTELLTVTLGGDELRRIWSQWFADADEVEHDPRSGLVRRIVGLAEDSSWLEGFLGVLEHERPEVAAEIDRLRALVRRRFQGRLRRRRGVASEPAPAVRGWLEAAAVLDDFDPGELRPFGAAEGRASEALAPWVVERPDGRWVLQEQWRRRYLDGLIDSHRVGAAQAVNPGQVGRLAQFLGLLAEGRMPEYRGFGLDDLSRLAEALRRVAGRVPLPARADAAVAAFIERRRTIEPLRLLAGAHFRGRSAELGRLRRHVSATELPDTFVVWGPGGVGKSALLGALLLAQEDATEPEPFVYLNFDHSHLDPMQPARLLETAAQQLGLLYAAQREVSLSFTALASGFAGDALSFAARVGTTLDDAAGALVAGLSRLGRACPFLIVLDTFERVQIRGVPAVLAVRSFVDALRLRCPRTRVVISSRVPVVNWGEVEEMHLEPLVHEEAIEVLRALAIEDDLLAHVLVERFGTSPLTLRLVADAVGRVGRRGGDGVELHAQLVGEARDEFVQQALYTRILGHLGDREVEALVHPGLVVRRVTRGVLAEVLAAPCGLDPAAADELFGRLRQQVTLFEAMSDGSLRHRSDVRGLMLRAMLADERYAATMREIHARAESYYNRGAGETERAELLYHRLWLGNTAPELDAVWSDELEPLLADALDEPLPAAARAWLAPRVTRAEAGGRSAGREPRAVEGTGQLARDLPPAIAELAALVAELRGAPPEPERVMRLEQRFIAAPDVALRGHAEVAAAALRILAPHSRDALRKGALALGRTFNEHGAFRFDSFVVGELLARVRGRLGAAELLARLAVQVGLPAVGFTPGELAASAIQHGRIGDALAFVLDYGDDDPVVQRGVADLLYPDPHTTKSEA